MDGRRLILDVDVGAEPISGSLQDPPGAPRAFEGYVELISALERLRRDAEPAVPPAGREPA